MPFFILSILIQVGLVIHVIKTGRNTIWIWVVVMLPLALEAEGNNSKACEEFETLVKYFPGAEAKCHYATLLRKTGAQTRAQEVLSQLLNDAEIASKHYRKAQQKWLTLAKRDLQK